MNHMGQLMGQQAPPLGVVGLIRPGIEHDVMPGGIRHRIDGPCRLGGVFVGVDPNIGQVLAQTRFEESATGFLERLAGAKAGDELRPGTSR